MNIRELFASFLSKEIGKEEFEKRLLECKDEPKDIMLFIETLKKQADALQEVLKIQGVNFTR